MCAVEAHESTIVFDERGPMRPLQVAKIRILRTEEGETAAEPSVPFRPGQRPDADGGGSSNPSTLATRMQAAERTRGLSRRYLCGTHHLLTAATHCSDHHPPPALSTLDE